MTASAAVCAGPSADVFAYAAAQVKAAMDATMRLGGSNYVFWCAGALVPRGSCPMRCMAPPAAGACIVSE